MKKLRFLFGSHCHQPVGNFDFIFRDALEGAYDPFFQLLAEFPGIRISAHFSGCLLDWLEENSPEFIDMVGTLVRREQIEMLGSGFYEPVLAAIPEWDRRGQIEMMNRYLRERFGTPAAGAWMTERVWEPHVVPSLLSSGIRYVVIDDYHFKCAGLRDEELDGYYVTENDGELLAVFPISEKLRYTIPFEDPKKTIDILRAAWEAGKRTVTMMDDGEKFGLWPGTSDLCYRDNWFRWSSRYLRRYCRGAHDNSIWSFHRHPDTLLL